MLNPGQYPTKRLASQVRSCLESGQNIPHRHLSRIHHRDRSLLCPRLNAVDIHHCFSHGLGDKRGFNFGELNIQHADDVANQLLRIKLHAIGRFLLNSVPELKEIFIQSHFLVTAGNGLPLASILNFYRSGELSQAAQYLKLSTAAGFRHLIGTGIQLLFEFLGRLAFLGNELFALQIIQYHLS